MQDGIIKGTGNSRYLKSVADFLSRYPKYEDMVAALVAGTLPIDLNGINTAGWSQQATALNKANLLSDTTETAIWGSAGNRTVDATLKELVRLVNEAKSSADSANASAGEKMFLVSGSYAGSSPSGNKTISLPGRPIFAFVDYYYNSRLTQVSAWRNSYSASAESFSFGPSYVVIPTTFNEHGVNYFYAIICD